MANIQQVRVSWTGFPGGPGVTTLYRPDSVGDDDNIFEFFDAIKGTLAAGITCIVEPSGIIIDEFTGTLTGAWTHLATDPVESGGSGVYSAPVGASVELRTGAVNNGRRVKGRIYLVPLSGYAFDGTGTLEVGVQGTIQTAANGLVGAGDELLVWHRPTTPNGTDGAGEPVTSSFVRDKAVVLKSRRD